MITPLKPESLLIENVRFHKGCIIMKLKGYNRISEAEKLKGFEIAIPENRLWPLGVDEYYHFQIIGLDVYTDKGLHLGEVKDIFPTGSNDVYTVKKGGKEYLIPAIKEVIQEVDLHRKRIIIHPIEGLLDPSNAL